MIESYPQATTGVYVAGKRFQEADICGHMADTAIVL